MSLLLFPQREKLRLPSVERPHIYRDPEPKSIHTRKHEPVEIGDVTHLVRDCDDRTSEAIQKFPRQSNPYGEWGSPYKVDKAFRPPMRDPWLDEQPLSRQKRPNTSVSAQAYFPFQTRTETMKTLDKQILKASVWSMPQPQETWVLGDYHERPSVDAYISPILYADAVSARPSVAGCSGVPDLNEAHPIDNAKRVLAPTVSTAAGLSEIQIVDMERGTVRNLRTITPISLLRPGFQIALYDSTDRTVKPLGIDEREKRHIAVEAFRKVPIDIRTRETGEHVRLKDYNWFILERPDGTNILTLDPHNRALPHLKQRIPGVELGTGVGALDGFGIGTVHGAIEPFSLADRPAVFAQVPGGQRIDFDLDRTIELQEKLHMQSLGTDRTTNVGEMALAHAVPTLRPRRGTAVVSEQPPSTVDLNPGHTAYMKTHATVREMAEGVGGIVTRAAGNGGLRRPGTRVVPERMTMANNVTHSVDGNGNVMRV